MTKYTVKNGQEQEQTVDNVIDAKIKIDNKDISEFKINEQTIKKIEFNEDAPVKETSGLGFVPKNPNEYKYTLEDGTIKINGDHTITSVMVGGRSKTRKNKYKKNRKSRTKSNRCTKLNNRTKSNRRTNRRRS